MPEDKDKILINGVETKHSELFLQIPVYKPNSKQELVIKNVWTRFTEMRTARDQNYKWFGKRRNGTYRTLIDYINICEKRWNSDGIPRVDLDDWQASVFKPETRNKIIAIISAVAQKRPGIKFVGVEKGDAIKEMVLGDLYDWSELKDDGDQMALYTMLDAIIHGTAIRYEGYEDEKRTIRELIPGKDGYDIKNIKTKERTIVKKRVFTQEVRLQDFYFGRVTTRKIGEMPDCVWRKIIRFSQFRLEFAGWEGAKFVVPGGDLTDETFFSAYASEDVKERDSDLIEVIRYYNKETDEFVILANGVWVNPMSGDESYPIPFAHKELPFFTVVFEPFASDFPYGKGAPDKYLHEQDAINALYNMMIDQAYVSVHPPLVTGDEDVIDDIDLVPGKTNYIGADVKNIQEIQISPPQNAHFNMLQLLQSSLEQSSVDSVQQGQTGQAGTATEVRVAAAASARTFLLFLEFVYHGYKRKAKLRTANILQFMTLPSELTKVLGDDGVAKFDEAFGAFKVDNVQLLNGKQGNRIIEMVPDQKTLEAKAKGIGKERLELEATDTEKIYITPDYIRNFQFDTEPVADSTIKETPEVRRAMEESFQLSANQLYPDLINREAMFEEFLRVWGKTNKNLKLLQGDMQQLQLQGQQQSGQQGKPIGRQITDQNTGGGQEIGTDKPSLNTLQTR